MLREPFIPCSQSRQGALNRAQTPRCASTRCDFELGSLWGSQSTPRAWTQPVPALHQANKAQGRWERRVQHL